MQIRCKDGAILDGIFSGEVIHSQGRQFLLTVMVNITARKRTEAELARLSVIQQTLTDLATHFVNVPLDLQDTAINESLATMGRLIDADRAYLFGYDFEAGIMINTHEWCGPGISPEIDNLQALPTALLPDWVAAHQQGKAMHVPSVEALPETSPLRQVLEPQGIRSLITLPLMLGDACIGFAGFDAVREARIWQDSDIAMLRVLAELYAHFEARRAREREARELQDHLIQARDAAQAAALAKSLFLANMSHEIRTPLNAVLGYAQIMQHECGTCPSGGRLSAITRSGEHLLELLTDLLELVRDDAHRITLTPSDFDFYQVLEDVRLMFERHPEAQGLTLEFSHAAEVPRFIHADSGKVRQILVNLVGNAFKFTQTGGVRVATSVLTDIGPNGLQLAVEVEDTGCGIGADELERIFDVFEQAQQGRKIGKGAGLGLPLSRRYARALDGDVTVTSRPGHGSRFRFTFSARAASADAAEQFGRGRVLRLAAGQTACQVLVVDDEPENRDMLTIMLRAAGFDIEVADNAEQALGRLSQTHRIDLVLMDKRLPDMDGYGAIGLLRKLPGGRELPVLVVTASGAADEKELALAAGANGYISKPVHREQLLEEIGRVTDVRYEYELPAVAGPATVDPCNFNSPMAQRLPAETCVLLDQALRRGDIRRLRELIAGFRNEHAELSSRMTVLADIYDYDRLRELLEAAKGENL
jgi:signal transduction histidine kinase/DNA-binding response OmpR family regulator